MNHIYCMLLPSILGLKIFAKINRNEKITKYNYIFYYFMFILFSNSISLVVCRLLFNTISSLELNLDNFPIFAIKYIIINLIINIILAFIFSIIRKEVTFSIKISEKDGKKDN